MNRIPRQSPLERYATKGELGATEAENLIHLEVGERYRAIHEAAIDRVGVANWEPRVSGGMADATILHSSRQKLRRIEEQLGRVQARGLRKVCVEGYSANEWARQEGETTKGAGLAMLRVALRELHRILAA